MSEQSGKNKKGRNFTSQKCLNIRCQGEVVPNRVSVKNQSQKIESKKSKSTVIS